MANFHFLHAESDKLKIVYPIRVNIPKTLIGAHSSEKINCFQSGATSCVNNDIMISHTTWHISWSLSSSYLIINQKTTKLTQKKLIRTSRYQNDQKMLHFQYKRENSNFGNHKSWWSLILLLQHQSLERMKFHTKLFADKF